MSLKEEIEKLINLERRRLADDEDRRAERCADRVRRFSPIRAFLKSLVAAIDPRYLEAQFFDDQARVKIGRPDPTFSIDIDCEIGIDDSSCPDADEQDIGEGRFVIKETTYYRMERETLDRMVSIETAEEVAEHLTRLIVEKVAYYRHLDDTSANMRRQNLSDEKIGQSQG